MATLTGIRIRNFKAVGERQAELALAPITLLYGPNGAGKSTILHALHYAREILERGNLDPDRTLSGGELDLGGFRNLIHGRDLSREIILGFDLNVAAEGMPTFGISGDEREDMGLVDRLRPLDVVQEISIDIHVAWSGLKRRPYIARWAVKIEGEHFASLTCTPDLANVSLTEFNADHPYLNEYPDDFVPDEDHDPNENSLGSLLFYGLSAGSVGVVDTADGARPILDVPLSLEILDTDLNLLFSTSDSESEANIVSSAVSAAQSSARQQNAATIYVSRAIVGAGMVLRDCLRKLLYIGPLSTLPSRDFSPVRSADPARWANGLGAWDRLATANKALLEQINDWMVNRLQSGFGLFHDRYREVRATDQLAIIIKRGPLLDDLEAIADAYNDMPTERRMSLCDMRRRLVVAPHDIGIGISQVLPVIVAALDPNAPLVLIEQPELHVHPALQTALGDLFATAVDRSGETADEDSYFDPDNRVFIIETHSEHLVLRLLRRIRERHEQTAEEGAPVVLPGQLSINYAEPTEDGIRLHHLRVDETGEFIDRWPKGFFAEREAELF